MTIALAIAMLGVAMVLTLSAIADALRAINSTLQNIALMLGAIHRTIIELKD